MRPRHLTKPATAAAAGLALLLGTMTSGAAETSQVKEEVLQNNPDKASGKFVIVDRLAELIRDKSNTEIMIATYHVNDLSIAKDLAAALDRGVRVRVVADGRDHNKEAYKTIANAVKDGPAGSWIRHCGEPDKPADNDGSSCMGKHIMHNKFLLFKRKDEPKNVVVQTSANLNGTSGTNMWNTAYIAPDPWLYSKYEAYFGDLAASADPDRGDDNYYNTFRSRYSPSNGKYTMNVSPRASGNVYLDVLNDVRCKGNTSGGTDGDHRTIVRVGTMSVRGHNGAAIARRLWELDNQGCYVDIVADDISVMKNRKDSKHALEYLLRRPEALPPDRQNYHGPEIREFSGKQCGVHQKNLLIDGHYKGQRNQKIVVTGSHNMNDKSPKFNDEVILQINSASVHEQFKQAFFEMRSAAALTWQTSKNDVDPKRNPKYNC